MTLMSSLAVELSTSFEMIRETVNDLCRAAGPGRVIAEMGHEFTSPTGAMFRDSDLTPWAEDQVRAKISPAHRPTAGGGA